MSKGVGCTSYQLLPLSSKCTSHCVISETGSVPSRYFYHLTAGMMAPGSCKFGSQRVPQHPLPWATSQECLWYSQCMQPLPAASCSTESFSSTSFGAPYQQSCGQQPPKFHPPSVGVSGRAPRETSPTESFPAGGFPAS